MNTVQTTGQGTQQEHRLFRDEAAPDAKATKEIRQWLKELETWQGEMKLQKHQSRLPGQESQ